MRAPVTKPVIRSLVSCVTITFWIWCPGFAQPVIYGISRTSPSGSQVERLDLATGQTEQLLTGDWLYSLDLDKAHNDLYVGGPHILRYELDTAIIDTVLTNKTFRDLHGWRGGTPCDHRGISLDTLNRQIYATGECWGGPHLIRVNLDGTGLEWIDGVHGLDVAIDYEYGRSWAYIRNEDYLTRYRVDVWHPERLIESDVVDLEIDHGAQKIYWHDQKAIMRIDHDGTNFEYVVNQSDVGSIRAMTLDTSRRHLYFSADGLFRVDLDGSSLIQISEHHYDGLAIDEAPANTAIGDVAIPLSGFELSQNFPNPFSRTTSIRYTLPRAADVQMTVHDLLGRTIQVLANEPKTSGRHDELFEARDLPAGTYIFRLRADHFIQSRSFVIAK